MLLDRLHEELCYDFTQVTSANNNNNSIITDTFQGELKNIVRVCVCCVQCVVCVFCDGL